MNTDPPPLDDGPGVGVDGAGGLGTLTARAEGEPDSLVAHFQKMILLGLSRLEAHDVVDVYACSLWLNYEDDDPERPFFEFSVNTEAQVALMMATGRPTSPSEARWNFAFWRQETLSIIGSTTALSGFADPTGERLIAAVVRDAGNEDANAMIVSAAIRAAQALRNSGAIEVALGKSVPIITHDLEYADDVVSWNTLANGHCPLGFTDWLEE